MIGDSNFYNCTTVCAVVSSTRPPLSKQSFPLGRVGKKTDQPGGQDLFFFLISFL